MRLDWLQGSTTVGALMNELDERASDFAHGVEFAVVSNYRRWALESAAVDLALQQAGIGMPGARP